MQNAQKAGRADGEKLHAAVRSNDEKLVSSCLASDMCNIEYRTQKDLWTSLIRASHDGHEQIVKLLLEANADTNAASSLCRTPLHVAAYANHAAIVSLLVTAGADAELKDISDRTPLDYAKNYGEETEIAKALAQAEQGNMRKDRIRRHQRKVFAAVEMAAEMRSQVTGRQAALRRLVASNNMWEGEAAQVQGEAAMEQIVDGTLESSRSGNPREGAALFASAFGKLKALKALLSSDSDTVVHGIEDKVGGNTPLHWAVLHKQLESVELLVGAGADPTRRNREGRSPLEIARDENFEAAVVAMERTPKGREDAARRKFDEERLLEHDREERARTMARARTEFSLGSMTY